MRAIRVREQRPPEVLVVEEVEAPRPARGQVSVGLHAAGVNMIDVQQRSGGYPVEVPFTPGTEEAGEVGEGVDGWAPGDRVAYANVPGAYAELAVVPAERLVPGAGRGLDRAGCGGAPPGDDGASPRPLGRSVERGGVVVVQAAAVGSGACSPRWRPLAAST